MRKEPSAVLSLAAIGSIVAASSCCLPVLPFLTAAGIASSSVFLSAARPYLLVISILFIGFGFYQGWRARRCNRRPGALTSILLWTSAAFVFVSIAFPELMANTAASLLDGGSQTVPGQPPVERLTGQNVRDIQNQFNASHDKVRVLLLLSPT